LKKDDDNEPVIEYQAVEIYRELISEKDGKPPASEEHKVKRVKMRAFLKETLNTEDIEMVNLEDLK
jgi:hypothetical protein